jgi:hypothetical protein
MSDMASNFEDRKSHMPGKPQRAGGLCLLASVLLLCSCATRPQPSGVTPGPELPPDVGMNKDAGRGGHLIITLRLESGAALPCVVDTGSPMTILDRSLEPGLGPCLGTETLSNFGTQYEARVYAAPRLYLGNTPLVTDSTVLTCDLPKLMSAEADRPIRGILGMDCLQHYCILLDFRAGKMRFLDPARVKPAQLGRAFPLTFSNAGNGHAQWIRPFIRHAGLVGGEDVDLLIDTGANWDSALAPGLFRREVRAQKLRENEDAAQDPEPNSISLPQCVWNGATYTSIWLGNGADSADRASGENLLGLRFLARHFVTFDFPRRTMYLKRTSSGPLVTREAAAAAQTAGNSAFRHARKLIRNGQLPGWSRKDRPPASALFHFRRDPDTAILDIPKKGDSSTYHYEFTRASPDSPWQLQKAWRADRNGRVVEDYPTP